MCRVILNSEFAKHFYNTDIKVYKKIITGGYDVSETAEEICTVRSDVQPYSGALAREEYGLDIDRALKIFCDRDGRITEGAYISVNGTEYIVKYVESWGIGMMIVAQMCGHGAGI